MRSFDEDQLPHVTSCVERFLVDSEGHADGMLLANGVEVHFSPRLAPDVLGAIQAGERVTVYGVLPMAGPLIEAVVIEAANGVRIVDVGVAAADSPVYQPLVSVLGGRWWQKSALGR
jgi:hypothetical protein